MSKHVLDFKDNDGKRYIWTKKEYDYHVNQHPELGDPTYLGRVKTVIFYPDEIYPAYKKKERYCFYMKEIVPIRWRQRYTLVVIDKVKASRILYIYMIRSSYRPDHIKELQYSIKPCQRP